MWAKAVPDNTHVFRPEHLNSLQVVRAYAALSVLIGHAILEWLETHAVQAPFDVGPLLHGVDIFFVLSGFVMLHTSRSLFERPGSESSLSFIRRRIIRIVPLYYLFTTLMVMVLVLLGPLVRSTEFDPENIISSYLFLPHQRDNGVIAPVLSLGWTLNYEMLFYGIFALALFVKGRGGLYIILSALTFLALAGLLVSPSNVPLYFWTRPIILEFGAGVLLAVFFHRFKIRNIATSLCLLLAGFVLMFIPFQAFSDLPRFLAAGIPATIIVAGAVTLPHNMDTRIPSWMTSLGDSSYALYLGHRFVLRLVTVTLGLISASWNSSLLFYVVVVTIIAVPMSLVVFRWIEQPLIKWLKARFPEKSRSITNGDA